jgi:protein-L-isoaspartate(D-aspartate) O-methyltransferase
MVGGRRHRDLMAKPGDFAQARARMVERQLRRRGIDDERVLAAMAEVPREQFVPERVRDSAYNDSALPIGHEQTISQPLVVARMAELLQLHGDERILDVGTGSGYHAALLARLGAHVWSVERHPALSEQAQRNLEAAKIYNVTLVVGDGGRGLPETAPFDAINVAAAGEREGLEALEAQLADGGRLVAPVTGRRQRLTVARREGRHVSWRRLEEVRFVPLVRDR